MQPESPKYLEDIRDSAQFILDVVSELSIELFRENRLLCQAVERNFEIIGEALNKLKKADAQTAESINHYPRIIAFRNILAHGYDILDRDVIWHIIQGNLPQLLQDVEKLLRQ